MKIYSYLLFTLILGFFLLTEMSCSKDPTTKHQSLKIAATSVPHAEILEQVKQELEGQEIDLTIIVVEDYNTPNRALADKEVDANFFQHIPFLDEQKKAFGFPLEILTKVHLEPMGLYSKKINELSELRQGAIVGIPSDPSNQARALCLLQANQLIELKKCDVTTSIQDISENKLQLKFEEIDSPLLARALDDVDLAALNTNFALQADLYPTKDALAIEDAKSLYVNVVVIRAGEENRLELQALKKALTSEKIRKFIQEHYKGEVIPIF